MRLFLLALTLLSMPLFTSLAHADTQELPTVTLSAKDIGGTVLLIQMKSSLVVNGADEASIVRELGTARKTYLFDRIVSDDTPEQLRKIYGGEKHPVTLALIAKYESLIAKPGEPLLKKI